MNNKHNRATEVAWDGHERRLAGNPVGRVGIVLTRSASTRTRERDTARQPCAHAPAQETGADVADKARR